MWVLISWLQKSADLDLRCFQKISSVFKNITSVVTFIFFALRIYKTIKRWFICKLSVTACMPCRNGKKSFLSFYVNCTEDVFICSFCTFSNISWKNGKLHGITNSIGNKLLDIKPTIGEYQSVVRNIRKEEVV